ncbi:FAD-dependent thymidylate synthase [bacterium]|nr:FAD-dependent thymidylate synthase [bacterium]
MEVKILEEAGYSWALCGASLSFKDESIPFEDWWTQERFENMEKTSKGLAFKDGGHNKFLESMQVWIYIKAPRGFWQEYDTYRSGVTKNSASTMHTIQRRPVTLADFEPNTDGRMVNIFNDILIEATDNFSSTKMLKGDALEKVKWSLPEGFLQSRIVNTNYKTIRNMVLQRRSHRLSQWQLFIDEFRNQCNYPDILPSKLV